MIFFPWLDKGKLLQMTKLANSPTSVNGKSPPSARPQQAIKVVYRFDKEPQEQ